MAGHVSFDAVRSKMSPDRRARVAAKVRKMKAEMLLAELRKHADLTQSEVAVALGITQPEVSRLEGEDDMQISTLSRLVRALGGQLEVAVTLPNLGRIRLTQFG